MTVLENPRPQGAAGAAGGRAGARARPHPQDFQTLAPAPARARIIFKLWPPHPPAPATIFQGPRGKSAPFFEMPFSFALGCFQAAETSLWFLF